MVTDVMQRPLTLVLWELKKVDYKAVLGSDEGTAECCEWQEQLSCLFATDVQTRTTEGVGAGKRVDCLPDSSEMD